MSDFFSGVGCPWCPLRTADKIADVSVCVYERRCMNKRSRDQRCISICVDYCARDISRARVIIITDSGLLLATGARGITRERERESYLSAVREVFSHGL